MSVYVGINVRRKRFQVAVVDQSGEVLTNRNVRNGVEPILKVIGGLPPGTPAAFEAGYGTSVAGGAAGGLRLQPDPGAPAAVQGDRVGAAEERRGPTPRSWPSCCGRTCCPKRGSPRRRCASCGTAAAPGPAGAAADAAAQPDPRHPGRSARPAGRRVLERPGRAWLASLELPAVSRELIEDDLALIDALQDRSTGSTGRSASMPGPTRGSRCSPSCRASARSPRWSSSPRPARSPGSARRASWRPGRGSPRPSAAATALPTTATSRRRVRCGCAGFCARRRRPPTAPGSAAS